MDCNERDITHTQWIIIIMTISNAARDVAIELSFIADRGAKWYSNSGKQFGSFL